VWRLSAIFVALELFGIIVGSVCVFSLRHVFTFFKLRKNSLKFITLDLNFFEKKNELLTRVFGRKSFFRSPKASALFAFARNTLDFWLFGWIVFAEKLNFFLKLKLRKVKFYWVVPCQRKRPSLARKRGSAEHPEPRNRQRLASASCTKIRLVYFLIRQQNTISTIMSTIQLSKCSRKKAK